MREKVMRQQEQSEKCHVMSDHEAKSEDSIHLRKVKETDSLLVSPEGTNPANTLSWASVLQSRETINSHCLSPMSVAPCYGSPSKLIMQAAR